MEVRLPDAELRRGDAAAVVSVGTTGSASVASRDTPEPVSLNGVLVGGPSPLLHGDRLSVGSHDLRFGDEAQLGDTLSLDSEFDVAIAVPSPSARSARSSGRLLSLVDGREYQVGSDGLTIGRDPSCDIVIASPRVSRRHASIRQLHSGYLLLDTSANGVFVNDARVQTELPLGRGDTLRVGSEEFRFYAEDRSGSDTAEFHPGLQHTGSFVAAPRAVAPVTVVPNAPPAPEITRPIYGTLEIINEGPSRGTRFVLDSPRIAVGRAPHNDVAVNDESVSEHHAKLQRREDSWYLLDLDSTNGTYLDGARIGDEVRLPSGSDVRFGGVKMRFRGTGSVARSSGETRVIVGVKGPDPKRAEQRLKELAEHAAPEPGEPARGISPTLWLIVIVLVILALYAVVRGGGQ